MLLNNMYVINISFSYFYFLIYAKIEKNICHLYNNNKYLTS